MVLENPDELTKEQIDNITAFFSLLSEPSQSQARQAFIRFVVDGGADDWSQFIDESIQESIGLFNEMFQLRNLRSQGRLRIRLLRSLWEGPYPVLVRFMELVTAIQVRTGRMVTKSVRFPDWIVLLIQIAAHPGETIKNFEKYSGPSLLGLAETLNWAGISKSDLVYSTLDLREWLYLTTGSNYYYEETQGCSRFFSECDLFFSSHLSEVKRFFESANSDQLADAISVLSACEFEFALLIEEIVALSVSRYATASKLALPIVTDHRGKALPLLLKVLEEGKAQERNKAVLVLASLYGDLVAEPLRKILVHEKSRIVRQSIETYLKSWQASTIPAAGDHEADLIPFESTVSLNPVPLKNREALAQKLLDRISMNKVVAARIYDEIRRRQIDGDPPISQAELMEKEIGKILDFVEGSETCTLSPAIKGVFDYPDRQFFSRLLSDDLEPIQVVRLLYILNLIQVYDRNGPSVFFKYGFPFSDYLARTGKSLDLRVLNTIVSKLPGCSEQENRILHTYLIYGEDSAAFSDWKPDSIWPAFYDNPQLLVDALSISHSYTGERRKSALRVLSYMPQVPASFVPILWNVAMGGNPKERALAQTALNKVHDIDKRLIDLLSDKKLSTRKIAVDWLGQVGTAVAIEALKGALKSDESDEVRAAIFQVLEKLGENLLVYLDRDALLQEARVGLGKKRPKGMDWIPLDALPVVRWQDTGESLPKEVLQWWIVQGVQMKSEEAPPLLKLYLELCKKDDVAIFSRFVLRLWIEQDLKPLDYEEASEKAEVLTSQMWRPGSTVLQEYESREQVYEAVFRQIRGEPIGSAIAQKGMLSIVSAAADDDCARLCHSYIQKHSGRRRAQCKALVTVLYSMGSNVALQILLTLAYRFKFRGVKDQAQAYVNDIVEKREWSYDELADRTIPDGGLTRPVDEKGEAISGAEPALELSYGARRFIIRLKDDLSLVLSRKEDNKELKTLPAPGKGDDPELAADAKKQLAAARKTIKEVVKLQTERLYEAMCTQRSWTYGDWRLYLADHPIVGRLCTRLIWSVDAPEKSKVESFRLLEDGSLTSANDAELKLSDDAVVRLAHSYNLDEDAAEGWQRHLGDYDVEPLFKQFNRANYILPDSDRAVYEITEFHGHMTTTFKLRTAATKLGYARGRAEEGGIFYSYVKPFPSLKVQAVIEFTGSRLPEVDCPAALKELNFTVLPKTQYDWPLKLDLREISPVLLAECYSDMKLISDQGSGFNENWEKLCFD